MVIAGRRWGDKMQRLEEVKRITAGLVADFAPEKVILFGSQAKGTARESSDIDLCVVVDTDKRRETLARMYLSIDSEIPVDLILYTPAQWRDNLAIEGSFACLIKEKGVVLYERFPAL